MEDWTADVSAKSLARGFGYFESGHVRSLDRQSDGWRAIVSGSVDYEVFVPNTMDPYQARCTCPYYEDGNVCKHIVATMYAAEELSGENEAESITSQGAYPSIEEIVANADARELRDLVVNFASRNDALRRELFATFRSADPKQAKRELQKTTTELIHRYERGGFIDWRDSLSFEDDYRAAIESIMRPIFSSGDADALIDLAIPRLVQLQRICIDDSNGFFTSMLADITDHLDRAFAAASTTQRRRLFDTMRDFMACNPGKDHGDIYWFELETVGDFLIERFGRDPQFAPNVMALADESIARIPPSPADTYDTHQYERRRWASAHLIAMSTLQTPVAELRGYAEAMGMLKSADVIRMLADAYVREGAPRNAVTILLENIDAHESRSLTLGTNRPPRIVDKLVELASKTYDESELSSLYVTLLRSNLGRDVSGSDVVTWYVRIRELTGEASWTAARSDLLDSLPAPIVSLCLSHEGSYEELYDHIMANGGKELMAYEKSLSALYPEPYVNHYLGEAASYMKIARDRNAYRNVAASLRHAASLPGGLERAQESAARIASDNPRRPALLDELRKAGFAI